MSSRRSLNILVVGIGSPLTPLLQGFVENIVREKIQGACVLCPSPDPKRTGPATLSARTLAESLKIQLFPNPLLNIDGMSLSNIQELLDFRKKDGVCSKLIIFCSPKVLTLIARAVSVDPLKPETELSLQPNKETGLIFLRVADAKMQCRQGCIGKKGEWARLNQVVSMLSMISSETAAA
jgi:hypothetical protein